MKKEWFLVILALGFVLAVNGCCSCKKDVQATDGMPSAYAQPVSQDSTGSAGYSSQRAVK